MRPKQRAALRKLFSLPQSPLHHPSDKIMLPLWNKNFLTEIYRNIQTFAFKVLQEYSSLASRNDATQMFFLTPNRNMFAGIFVKSERFLTMLREHIIFNVKWVEVRKMSEVFLERNCIVKWVIFFAGFCWLWDFLLENLKIKKNSDDVHWNMWTNTKALHTRNNILKKRILNMRFWIIYILGFLGNALRRFSQCFFLLFVVGQPWWPTFLLSLPPHHHHKKASYGPVICS